MPLNLTTSTNPNTAEKFALRNVSKGAVARSSKEWLETTTAAFRERAFFTANVSNVKVLSKMKEMLSDTINQTRSTGVVMSQSRFISDMKDMLQKEGYPMGGTSLTDITSNRRLKLIYDMNVQEAKEYARYINDQSSEVRLNMYPAWEFTRVHPRRFERQNWLRRWKNAGGKIYKGRMIALKTSDVWTKLSVFGRPWAPFDFGSGMGCRDIGRKECVQLGVIQPKEKLTPKPFDFNTDLYASGNGVDNEILKAAQLNGNLGKIEDGKVFPRPNPYPVSDALNVEIQDAVLRGDVEEAIRIINTVHGDGKLPVIPIKMNNRMSADGVYDPTYPQRTYIDVKKNEKSALSVIHEIGHFLDHRGLSEDGRFASASGKIEELRKAIRESNAVKIVIPKIREKGKEFKHKRTINFANYLDQDEECFARAYAQFITVESKDPNLLKILNEKRNSKIYYNDQWDDEDFKPIQLAFRKLFKTKGWM